MLNTIIHSKKERKKQFQNQAHVTNPKITNQSNKNLGIVELSKKIKFLHKKLKKKGYTWNRRKETKDMHKTTIIEIIDTRITRCSFPFTLFQLSFVILLLLVFHHRHVL